MLIEPSETEVIRSQPEKNIATNSPPQQIFPQFSSVAQLCPTLCNCSARDSQESSLTPQFKSINSSVLGFLYSPTLTSIHDYWKNCSFD